MFESRPLLIVVSAPSGAGKSTLCDRLIGEYADIYYSVSCTTRAPRGNERDGVDYFFVSRKDFLAKAQGGEFLEYATVHGNLYGTLKSTVGNALADGKTVLMDIDVQGASQVRQRVEEAPCGDPIKDGFVDIFISPPSLAELRRRLEGRAEDSPETIERRLKAAKLEMECARLYKYVVVNDNLERAYGELRAIIGKESVGGGED